MFSILKILGGVLSVLAIGGGLFINSQRATIIDKAVATAQETATKSLGVPVKIGGVDLSEVNFLSPGSNSDLIVHDVEIFDKQDVLIARVDEAKINFKLIALTDDPVAAIDEIKVNGATLNLTQRDDNSWNVNDIKTESKGESTFGAKIFLEGGTVNAAFAGKKISVEEISGSADCTDMKAIVATVNAKTLGSNVKASGTIGSDQQVINAEVDQIFFDKIVPYLPADKLPEDFKILGGTAKDTTLHVLRRGEVLTYLGSTKVADASVKIEKTDVKEINGNITFSEREVFLDASAVANGQRAAASGSIRLDTDEPFFDIQATTDSFAPAAIISDIGIDGAAAVRAHLVGTAKNPQVDAEISSDYLAYNNVAAQNISTKLRYFGEAIYLSDTRADVFGGTVTGTAEIRTDDLSFSANVKTSNLDAASLCDFAGSEEIVAGKISADVGLSGVGADPAKIKIFGNARAASVDFRNMHIDEANASFYWRENTLTIDYLSANLPNKGTLGVEGTVTGSKQIDLDFYGAHVDMTLLKDFNDALDMSGLADFKGAVHGDASNPNISIELSAVNNAEREGDHFIGKFFKQPFDSIQLAAAGSLDGVHIDKFELERGGQIKWKVIQGSVGLTGEKRVDIQLDTTEVRAEDIAALVAPDQPITGNVTNTVKITGTIDNPQVAGNIKFNRGSYHGMLLSGMTGDYFLEGDTLRLQEFNITSPMVDMVLNGTIDKNTHVMNFVVMAKDINLERFKAKLPENYTAAGHTTFEGIIKGTPDHPIFDGELKSEIITLNGVPLTDIYGHVAVNGSYVYLDDFRFNDGDGTYQLQVNTNLNDFSVNGEVQVVGADIAHMLTIADKKTDLITGTLDSTILLNGTFFRPTGSITGRISKGTFAKHDIHDVNLSASLNNNTLYIDHLYGKQGDKGTINLLGSVNLDGSALSMTLTAREIALGLFSKAAGYDIEMVGTSNIDAKLDGTFDNPSGEMTLTATGGIKGSTFDLLRGHFLFSDKRINVEEFIVQRELAGKVYGARVYGFIPLKAVLARSKENLPADEQINLTFSLDDADLSLLPVLSKQIAWGIGDLDGTLKITGTAASPQVNGKISLNDGSVKVKDMKTLIEHINIAMIFSGERFDIKNCTANVGGGTFKVTGGFSFPDLNFSNYNFDIVADALNINSTTFKGILNANFNVSEGTFFHRNLPKISGQVNLDDCRITVNSVPDSDEPPPELLLDVAVNLGDKVHLYRSRLYDMYLTGNVRIEGTTIHPKTSGSVNVKRGGTLTYLESVFNIREGEAHFNQIGTYMPTLHFFAETKIDRTKIYLTIDGPPNNFKMKLTSSPEMSETEIWRLLTLREAYSRGEGSLTAADALAIGLQMTIISELEDALKQSLGIDQFRVSRGSGSLFDHRTAEERKNADDANDYNVTIGKYVNDKLMLRYTRGFGSHKLNRYGIQYDFNDNIGLTIEREGKDYIFSIEARYKF